VPETANPAAPDLGGVLRERALAAVEDALRARLQDGEVRVSRGVLLVTGIA
jgi:hypothetical protein